MRWRNQPNKGPNLWDTRIVTRFLLLPKCKNGEWRWLEKASWNQVYAECYSEDFHYGSWKDKDDQWIDNHKQPL